MIEFSHALVSSDSPSIHARIYHLTDAGYPTLYREMPDAERDDRSQRCKEMPAPEARVVLMMMRLTSGA